MAVFVDDCETSDHFGDDILDVLDLLYFVFQRLHVHELLMVGDLLVLCFEVELGVDEEFTNVFETVLFLFQLLLLSLEGYLLTVEVLVVFFS